MPRLVHAAVLLFALTQFVSTSAQPNSARIFHSANHEFGVVVELDEMSRRILPVDFSRSSIRLSATMFSGPPDARKILWQRTIPSQSPFGVLETDNIIVSPRGDCFVYVSGERAGFSSADLYTTNKVIPLRIPSSTGFDRFHMRLAELEPLGESLLLRIWNPQKDSWHAFEVPSGASSTVTPELAKKWTVATHRKIQDIIAQRERESLLRRIASGGAVLRKITGLVPRRPSSQLNDADFAFLLRRKDPGDRQLIERLMFNDPSVIAPPPLFGCGGVMDWRRSYRFESGDFNQQRIDQYLAEWDQKGIADAWTHGDVRRPYLLAHLSGTIKLPTPVMANPGMIYIHLIPDGAENSRWTNNPLSSLLQCHLSEPWPEQPDLFDEIDFSFQSVRPGKYFLKCVWDKRAPSPDVLSAGRGDYESKLVGPLTIKAGDILTNVFAYCTNRPASGGPGYGADEAALRRWKVTGDLSPDSISPRKRSPEDPVDIFSRRADKWIVQTNKPAQVGRPFPLRLSLGPPAGWPRDRDLDPKATLLKIHMSESGPGVAYQKRIYTIIDEHGCRFQNFDSAFDEPVIFTRYPRGSKFRLVASREGSAERLWDVTLTNLSPVDRTSTKGQRLPLTKDLGPVTLTISAITFGSSGAPSAQYTFHDDAGKPAEGWALLDTKYLDAVGGPILTPTCPDQSTIEFRASAVLQSQGGLIEWKIPLPKSPPLVQFISFQHETNLFGMRLEALGIARSGSTEFKLPARSSVGMLFGSSGDPEFTMSAGMVRMDSSVPRLLLKAPRKFDKGILHLPGIGDSQTDTLPSGVYLDDETEILLVPLSASRFEQGAISIRASQKLPVHLTLGSR